jgi:hypothetical protein
MVECMVELRGLLVAFAGLNILLLVLAALCVVACHLQLVLRQVGHPSGPELLRGKDRMIGVLNTEPFFFALKLALLANVYHLLEDTY